MFLRKQSVPVKLTALSFGAMFLAAAGQASFAQQPSEQRQQRQQQMQQPMQREGNERGPMSRADRERWDITDEAIEGWITIKMAARPGFDNVNVEVQDGVARVSGKVASEAAEARALRVAGSTYGVRSVRDQLSVDKALANREIKRVPDRELAQQVARKIAGNIQGARAGEDWWFDGWRVEGPYNRWNFVVEADDGRISLEGEVPEMDIMRKAVEAARSVAGVRTVDSDLELEGYFGYYGYPYYGPMAGYYGRPHHPYAMEPYAWGPERRSERRAGDGQQRQQQSSR